MLCIDRHPRRPAGSKLAALAIAGLLLPAAALATPAVDTARLEQDLSARHRVPTRVALIARHGPAVADALRDVALQGKRPLARNRALSVLRLFPAPATERLLASVVDRYRHQRRLAGLALLELKQALVSYAVVAGKRALPRIEPLLAHRSIDLRCSAAEALRRSGSSRARALLAARLEIDPSRTVRAEIRAELAALAATTKR